MVPNCVLSGAYEGRFSCVMLEFNKRVYCDQEDRTLPQKLELLRDLIDIVINRSLKHSQPPSPDLFR